MLLDFEATVRKIKSSKIESIYFFYGEENFLQENLLDLLLERTVDSATKDFNFDMFYGSEVTDEKILQSALSFPMMSDIRTVVVKEFDKVSFSEKNKEAFIKYLNNPQTSTCLILLSQKTDFKQKLYSELKNKAFCIECKPLYENEIPEWINMWVKRKDFEISQEAVNLLQSYVGNSLRELSGEIDKLTLFLKDRKSISVSDIEKMVGASRTYNIFELNNAIGRKDLKTALTMSQAMVESGESPIGMIVMMTRHFISLSKLKELIAEGIPKTELAKKANLNPYFLNRYIEQLKNFSKDKIENCFEYLLNADVELKSTSRDPKLIMDMLIYKLIK
jgi:DNA polymerase-3 subunit delta